MRIVELIYMVMVIILFFTLFAPIMLFLLMIEGFKGNRKYT